MYISNHRKQSESDISFYASCVKYFLQSGCKHFLRNPLLPLFLVAEILLISITLLSRQKIFAYSSATPFFAIFDTLAIIVLLTLIFCITILLIICTGIPQNFFKFSRAFHRINFTNAAGQIPILLKFKHTDSINNLLFYAPGLPLSIWNDRKELLESALNIHIAIVYPGIDNQHIEMKAVDGTTQLSENLPWEYDIPVNSIDFLLSLGKGHLGPVTHNLATVPHILIGGATGSGKTILLKHLLYQCTIKQAQVIIADFKGGVDYPHWWHKNCTFITDKDTLIKQLQELIDILESRKTLLRSAEAANIADYNEYTGEHLPRIIFACDEVAELLDKTGADKTLKEQLATIENYLSTIARQGRAFGLHLILATQRPDANILSGQIKNNISYRICGRADQVLSQIILDNTEAAEQIPKNARGRFLDSDGTLFQGYNFNDKNLK